MSERELALRVFSNFQDKIRLFSFHKSILREEPSEINIYPRQTATFIVARSPIIPRNIFAKMTLIGATDYDPPELDMLRFLHMLYRDTPQKLLQDPSYDGTVETSAGFCKAYLMKIQFPIYTGKWVTIGSVSDDPESPHLIEAIAILPNEHDFPPYVPVPYR